MTFGGWQIFTEVVKFNLPNIWLAKEAEKNKEKPNNPMIILMKIEPTLKIAVY